jgi:hypothetical protein
MAPRPAPRPTVTKTSKMVSSARTSTMGQTTSTTRLLVRRAVHVR